jgi:hypothetical protein
MSIPLRTIPCLLAAISIASVALAQDRPRFPNGRAPPVQNARIATTGYTLIEAEALVLGAIASTGGVSAQPMAGFGPNWSGNSQLFWAPAASNPRDPATLKVTFNVPSPGDYSIRLAYTKAPEYGDLQLYVAGRLDRELNGYAPNVQRSVTTLADQHFDSGPNELMLKVFRKNAQSRGYFAGLDSIELLLIESGANRATQTQAAGGGQSTMQQKAGDPLLGFSAKLAFSVPDAKLNQGALGGVEGDMYESNPKMLLAYETTATGYQWRWQVATQPFPTESALSVPGMIAQGDAGKSPFTIDLSHVPPIGTPLQVVLPGGVQPAQGGGAPAAQVSAKKAGPMTLHARLVPVLNGAVAGPPSNTVTSHYKSGMSPPEQAAIGAANAETFKQKMLGFTISVVDYEPAKWPNQIGCVIVMTNPYELPHKLGSFPVSQNPYCPPHKPEGRDDALYWIGEAVHGWFLAYDLGAEYYNSAKAWIVDQVVGPIPCEWLGDDLENTCDGALHVLVDTAITGAMASVGVPPSMPKLAQLADAAKGDLIDAAVDFTCDQVKEAGDHECDTLVKEALREIYEQGLEQMIKDAKRGASEPDCDNAELGVNHVLLPCFTDYPGVVVKPAPGAVYEPPMVTLKVTRTAPAPSPYLACSLRMTLHATNHFSGTSYVQGQMLPAKDIAGELYEPAEAAIELLQPGQSATLKVAFQKMRLFSIATNTPSPNGSLGEWGALYWGGKGTLGVTTWGPLPKSVSGGTAPCSQPVATSLNLPNKP